MPRKSKTSEETKQIIYDSCMLDLETLGTLPGCVFVSIGAVEFNRYTGDMGRSFYQKIKIQSALDVGLFVEGGTIEWWLKQSEAAREEILKNTKDITLVLQEFSSWYNKSQGIWGNGEDFDISILKMGYHACKLPIPWKYDMARDVRTIMAEDPKSKYATKFLGIRHEPIADCEHQIAYLCNAFKNKIKQ